jgi:tetratricopeptide (TPR) repeat protein
MRISIDSWVEAALNADSTELAQLITGLPPSGTQSVAASLAQGSVLDSRVYALRSVSQDHSVGGDPELAAALATVGIRFCERSYELYGPGTANTFVFGVGQFAIDAHRAYDRMGRRVDQLAVVENALEWLKARDAEERHLADLRFARVEALIEQGRVEEAREGLDAEVAAGNTGHPSFGLLDQRIRSRLISATERKDERSIEEQTADQRQGTLNSAIKGLSSIAPEFAELLEGLGAQVDEQREVLSPSESITRDSSMYQQLGRFMESMAGGSGNQIRLNAAIQEASAILADPKRSYDPVSLDQARQSLEAVRQEAISVGLEDTAIDTLWPLYICYKRLERYDEALATLQSIRPWVRERRALIQDPLKRAGISKQYPHLYVELGARLIERGDSAELLSAIEEAKGRALADMLAVEAHREGLLIAPELAASWLPELMTKLDSHYVTFLADEDVTYAVCVDREGGLHSARLSIGTRLIDELREDLDPSRWGKKTTGFFAAPDDVAQQLSPLVDWLGELVDVETLREGDHICYSPDDLLHLVPLHYVGFRGAPFVKFVSLSRTHSATLLHYFAQKATSRPTHYIAVKVALADEAENDRDKVGKLGRASDWLDSGPLPGKRLDDEKVDLPSLASQDLVRAVVHFATHGYFPRPEETTDPFRGSGVVLSENGKLPRDAKRGELLSPERIIDKGSPFEFDGSHVSLQACVSGLSEEGVGGDALGLEWSLLMAGAASVLSTHWNIPVESSADFCIRFYEEWLLNGTSRAQAWRNAVLSQMDDNKGFEGDRAYRWAAFSLAGDWR